MGGGLPDLIRVIAERDRTVAQEAGDVLMAKDLLREPTLEGAAQDVVAVLLEQLVEPLDVA